MLLDKAFKTLRYFRVICALGRAYYDKNIDFIESYFDAEASPLTFSTHNNNRNKIPSLLIPKFLSHV